MSLDVLITGANRGIGLELARQMQARGDHVIAACRNPAAAEELNALGVRVEELDVTDGRSVSRVAEVLHEVGLDVLINNAGVGVRSQPLGETDYEQFSRFVDVNTLGPLRVVEAMLPALRRGQRKLIANMTSRMGSIGDNTSGGSYAYRASKSALNMVTRTLALDLAGEGVTCVVLHPGWVQTSMGGQAAPTTVEDSVAGLLRVIDGAGSTESGEFFDFSGQHLPW